MGDVCPRDLVTQARDGAAVDTTGVTWEETSVQRSRPSSQWATVADFAVSFYRVDTLNRVTVDTTFTLVVEADDRGVPKLVSSWAGRLHP